MRGRLIQPFIAVIRRLDALETSEVVGGGYDDEFNEAIIIDDDTYLGASSRREMDELRIPVQIDRQTWDAVRLTPAGQQPEADVLLIMHWPDLVNAGLIDTDGRALLQPGDRISSIETIAGDLVEEFPNPPGFFVSNIERAGYGLAAFGTPEPNLLFVSCSYSRVGS